MEWVWYDINRNKEHLGNEFGKEEEFSLNQNNQTEICIGSWLLRDSNAEEKEQRFENYSDRRV